MTDLVTQVADRATRYQQLLARRDGPWTQADSDELWALESELNAIHRLLAERVARRETLGPSPRRARILPAITVTTGRPLITPARRIEAALLRGPLGLRGQCYPTRLLVERCEDIPGADTKAVRAVLKDLVTRGAVRRSADQWSAA